ncbi:SurA N-terminal domain-containing protein [Evansella sp. AB-rgal1]|uniref:SurA N-terminal domain-containing protein n=1 Tax=Evansella sp. AB-rgal1 TaxID=3242696 RepID=UPI00359D8DF7
MKKVIGAAIISLTFIGLMACSNDNSSEMLEGGQPPGDAGNELQSAEALFNIEDYPEVIAVVNGEELEREVYVTALEEEALMLQAQGFDFQGEEAAEYLTMLEQQLLEQFITEKTLNFEAEKAGLDATDEEVKQELETVMAQNQIPSEEDLVQILEQQGASIDELRDDIAMFVKRQKFIEQQLDSTTITDEQIQEEYDNLVAQIEESGEDSEIPPLEEVQGEIRDYLEMEHQEGQYAEILERIREESDITINI